MSELSLSPEILTINSNKSVGGVTPGCSSCGEIVCTDYTETEDSYEEIVVPLELVIGPNFRAGFIPPFRFE